MAGLTDILGSILDQGSVEKISQQLGADPATTQKALGSALPALLGRMADNAGTEDGAQALANAVAKDHDGSILDSLGDFLGGGQADGAGPKILGHVFGADQEATTQRIAQETGLGADKAGGLLATLAPLVMGALGKVGASSGGLQAGGLSALLAGAAKQLGGLGGSGGGGGGAGAGAAGGMAAKVTGMLDKNKDGSIADDLQRLTKSGPLKKLLGRLRKR